HRGDPHQVGRAAAEGDVLGAVVVELVLPRRVAGRDGDGLRILENLHAARVSRPVDRSWSQAGVARPWRPSPRMKRVAPSTVSPDAITSMPRRVSWASAASRVIGHCSYEESRSERMQAWGRALSS